MKICLLLIDISFSCWNFAAAVLRWGTSCVSALLLCFMNYEYYKQFVIDDIELKTMAPLEPLSVTRSRMVLIIKVIMNQST